MKVHGWVIIAGCISVLFSSFSCSRASFGLISTPYDDEDDIQRQMLEMLRSVNSRMQNITKLEAEIDALWLLLNTMNQTSSQMSVTSQPVKGGQLKLDDSAIYELDQEVVELKGQVENLQYDVNLVKDNVGDMKNEHEEQIKDIKYSLSNTESMISDIEKSLSEKSVLLDELKNVTNDLEQTMPKNRQGRSIDFPFAEENELYSNLKSDVNLKDEEKDQKIMDMENRIQKLEREMQKLLKVCA